MNHPHEGRVPRRGLPQIPVALTPVARGGPFLSFIVLFLLPALLDDQGLADYLVEVYSIWPHRTGAP
jgi:hypothetical protein